MSSAERRSARLVCKQAKNALSTSIDDKKSTTTTTSITYKTNKNRQKTCIPSKKRNNNNNYKRRKKSRKIVNSSHRVIKAMTREKEPRKPKLVVLEAARTRRRKRENILKSPTNDARLINDSNELSNTSMYISTVGEPVLPIIQTNEPNNRPILETSPGPQISPGISQHSHHNHYDHHYYSYYPHLPNVNSQLGKETSKFEKACRQLANLDKHIHDLHNSFSSSIECDRKTFKILYRMQLATYEGTRNAYIEYIERQMEKIKRLRRLVLDANYLNQADATFSQD